MFRKTLIIFSLIGLLLSLGIGRTSGYGALGYVDASDNNLYVLNHSIRLGRIVWQKIPASERGFYFNRSPWPTTDDIQVSMWVPTVFFAICCLYFFLSRGPYRRRKRNKLGLCLKCGSDLRGSKDGCPECGKGFAPLDTHVYKASSIASSSFVIVAFHLTLFPATLVFLDWLLGHSLSAKGLTVPPGVFDINRALSEFLHPIVLLIYMAILFVEGALAWLLFRRRRGPHFRLFLSSWRRICLWGVLSLPVVSAAGALFSRTYTDGINFPLLWVPVAAVLVTVTTRMTYAQGHCQECGYDLRGSADICPECGTEFST